MWNISKQINHHVMLSLHGYTGEEDIKWNQSKESLIYSELRPSPSLLLIKTNHISLAITLNKANCRDGNPWAINFAFNNYWRHSLTAHDWLNSDENACKNYFLFPLNLFKSQATNRQDVEVTWQSIAAVDLYLWQSLVAIQIDNPPRPEISVWQYLGRDHFEARRENTLTAISCR